MQYKVYDLLLALPQDLQTTRALLHHHPPHWPAWPASLPPWCQVHYLYGRQEFQISTAAHLWNCVHHLWVLTLIPVCWATHFIIQDFYNRLVVDDQKWHLGVSLYLGWAVSGLLLLCCACTSGEPQGPGHYMACSSASAPHSASHGPSEYPT